MCVVVCLLFNAFLYFYMHFYMHSLNVENSKYKEFCRPRERSHMKTLGSGQKPTRQKPTGQKPTYLGQKPTLIYIYINNHLIIVHV